MERKHNNPNCDECVRRDTSNSWSDLPSDLLISVFQCLGFADLQRAKSVCSSWHSVSKQSVPKNQIPWLILFPENSNYCRLFNPEEKDRLYQTKDLGFEFAKCDCIATYGNWLLMRDPGSYFYIVNLFTQERINLPPVESQIGMTKIERTLDNHFRISNDLITPMYWRCMFTSSPVFWIDDTTKDYIVLWGLAGCCVVYSKKGDNFWNQIPESATYFDIVYKDHKLYITAYRNSFRIIDFSGEIPQETFQCYLYVHRLDKRYRFYDTKIVVTVSGDVLKVRKAWRSGFRIFKIYDSSSGLLKKSEKVESLGNEVIILDLGITVLANQLEEFNTNAIYFNGNYIKNPNTMFHFKLDTKKFERLDKFECSPVQFSSAHCFLPSFKQT